MTSPQATTVHYTVGLTFEHSPGKTFVFRSSAYGESTLPLTQVLEEVSRFLGKEEAEFLLTLPHFKLHFPHGMTEAPVVLR